LAIYDSGRLRYVFGFVTGLILAQLIVGASMRHQHAGLAIPDFPSAYGTWWPATDADSIARYNRGRVEVTALNPITAAQVTLQMAHRVGALCIFGAVAWLAGAARSRVGAGSPVARLAALWFGAILLQVILGAATIWTNKAADLATAHVAVGALSLVIGSLATLVTWRAGCLLGVAATVRSQAEFSNGNENDAAAQPSASMSRDLTVAATRDSNTAARPASPDNGQAANSASPGVETGAMKSSA